MRHHAPNCLVCDVLLDSTDDPGGFSPVPMPNGATQFLASGNYGSTVWDPQSEDRIELMVWVCDSCLLARRSAVLLAQSLPMLPQVTLSRWRA
jgi:hypothetical protein